MQHFAAIICVKNYYMMFATNSARPASRLWYFLAPPGSTSRPVATPLALIRRELSRFPGVTVIPIDEFRTSQICSKCMTRMGGPSPFGSWRLKACPHCRAVWDRDVNAARNILYLGDRMDANAGARPEPFCRG